jgi:matrixin
MRRCSPWFALVALVLCAPGAQAQRYQRTLVPGLPYCVLWPGRDYVYRLDAAGSRRTPGDSEFAALEAAFASWRAVSATCSDFTFTRGPDIQNPRVGYVRNSQDPNANENVITFREVDCNDIVPPDDPCIESDTCANTYACWDHGAAVIALTTTTFVFRTAYILDADVEFNASVNGRGFFFTTVDSPMCEGAQATDCVVTDVQNTATHEFGHVVGLDHVFEIGSTMEPTAPPGETHKRIIDAGSAAGFCQAYPRGLPPTQCVGTEPGRHFQAVSQGPGVGCGAAPEVLFPTAGLLGLLALGRRRKRPAGRDGAASRPRSD